MLFLLFGLLAQFFTVLLVTLTDKLKHLIRPCASVLGNGRHMDNNALAL